MFGPSLPVQIDHARHLISGDEIRLIRLHPGSGGSPLRTRVYYRHLSENPDYQALSYTWGSPFNKDHPLWKTSSNPTPQHHVLVNGRAIKVKRSLRDALLQLRHSHLHLLLWIDAICIDQFHEKEKTCQIQKMREIYDKASRLLVWLGPADATSDVAMRALQAGYRHSIRSQPYMDNPMSIYVTLPEAKNEQERSDEMNASSMGKLFGVTRPDAEIPDYPIQAVANLLNRAYWGRGWCWQEFAVPKKMSIVCGKEILEDGDKCISTFLGTWDALVEQTGSGRQPFSLDHRPWSMMALRRAYHNRAYIESTGWKDDGSIEKTEVDPPPLWAHENPNLNDFGKAWIHRDAVSRLSMKKLLTESKVSWLEASRKEDQILAIVGLASDAEDLGIQVDCAISWEKTYTQLAVAFLKRGDLWFLNYCQDTWPDRSNDLPSWVANWSHGFHGARISRHYSPSPNHLGTLEKEIQPDVRDVESNGLLGLRGIVIDEIVRVSPERFFMSITTLKTASRDGLYQWIRNLATEFDFRSLRCMWTVLIAGSVKLPLPTVYFNKMNDEQRRSVLDDAMASILRQDRSTDEELQKVIESYLWCFMQATNGRCIFQTRKGYIGLGNTATRRGDNVVVFMGAEAPFVVRPVLWYTVNRPRYRVLGESYVYELMDDEKLRASATVKDIFLE